MAEVRRRRILGRDQASHCGSDGSGAAITRGGGPKGNRSRRRAIGRLAQCSCSWPCAVSFPTEGSARKASCRARPPDYQECGKTYGESLAEVRRAILNIEAAIALPVLLQGDVS